jgi:NifU-like protein involved in Fe-S cluster formation
MAELDAIYNAKIMELAAGIPPAGRLDTPDATATAHSKLCGSTITVDVTMAGDHVEGYAQTVKACLLGQASASVVAQHIVGASAAEIREAGRAMRAMLKAGGPPPEGRFADLAALAPVRDHKARHASTLLVFDAVERALDQADGKIAVAVA